MKFRELIKKRAHWAWLGMGAFLTGSFLVISSEISELVGGQKELLGTIDESFTSTLTQFRSPGLTIIAIDLTALGSATILALLTFSAVLFQLMRKNYFDFSFLMISALGSGGFTYLLKAYFERSRPDQSMRLVNAGGFSYPSGHSLASSAIYLALAIVISRKLKTSKESGILFLLGMGLISIIGLSRIYLGVHYLSDVVAGIMIGIAWTSILNSVFLFSRSKEKQSELL